MSSLCIVGERYRLTPRDNLFPKMISKEHCIQIAFRGLLNQNLSTEKSIKRSRRLQRRGRSALWPLLHLEEEVLRGLRLREVKMSKTLETYFNSKLRKSIIR